MNNLEFPEFVLKGRNYMRYFLVGLIFSMLVLGYYAVSFTGYIIFLPIAVAVVLGIYAIRFPSISVFQTYLLIEKKAFLKALSGSEKISFDSIERVEFIPGHLNVSQMILQAFMDTAAYGGFSKAEQITLFLRNDNQKVILRIGSKKNFSELFKILKRKNKPST